MVYHLSTEAEDMWTDEQLREQGWTDEPFADTIFLRLELLSPFLPFSIGRATVIPCSAACRVFEVLMSVRFIEPPLHFLRRVASMARRSIDGILPVKISIH